MGMWTKKPEMIWKQKREIKNKGREENKDRRYGIQMWVTVKVVTDQTTIIYNNISPKSFNYMHI